MNKDKQFILWFNELGIEDVPLVGGKNASLGEMYRNLTPKGVTIPNGFAVTAYAYRYLLEKTGARDQIKSILGGLDVLDLDNLSERGSRIRTLIKNLEFPQELHKAIVDAYVKMAKEYGSNPDCAVRSSATAEDLPDASFAGQQDTYLNISGNENLIDACKRCFASLFTNRAIAYRVEKKFDHFSIALSIGVQKMVRSDLACSGVMFSIDTESGFKDAVFINAAYGLGENVVQGSVNPDEYYIFKPTLRKGFRPIIKKQLGDKQLRMQYTKDHKHPVRNVRVALEDQKRFVLSEDEIISLAKMACTIEDHYTQKRGKTTPMDMEWAKDGTTGKLFIVQARPETVQSQKDHSKLITYILQEKGKVLVTGNSVGERIGQGKAHIIKSSEQIKEFRKGEVLVTEMTDPDWVPIMKLAGGIVTNRGGRTCFGADTKILTNEGFKTMEQVYETGHEGLLTLSFNKQTKKTEWKPIIASMKRQSQKIKVSVSHKGLVLDNTLEVTPNHRMVNIRSGKLVDTELQEMIANQEMLCVAQRIPPLEIASEKDLKLAYLLGGIMTDGSVYTARTHGEVQFIQKRVPEKEQFIAKMQECMTDVYKKSFRACEKAVSSGMIRGKEAIGQATAFRLYSKQIAYEVAEQEQTIVTTLLQGSEELCCHFLAGVIDGDGSFYNNRIQIYVSEQNLLEGVVVACLKLGIMPQVTRNRTIFNVQIVEKLKTLLSYTRRVKGTVRERTVKTRFFAARQLFDEGVIGNEKTRRDKNLYISEEVLREAGKMNDLLESDLRMQRVIPTGQEDFGDVYNITVADNHTYVVFTERLSPVVVNNCHASIVSRELGIPCIVGTLNATEVLHTGKEVTVDCTRGSTGYIYEGILKYLKKETDLKTIPRTRTKIMMNLGSPEQAFDQSFLPNDGVGLAREEFIINNYIKVHPLALLHYKTLKDENAKKVIAELTYSWKDKAQYFVDRLAEGIGMIAAAFYPKPVIVRLSDFKSNEYANLIGGQEFEPKEDNPMIGWRGASRYYSEQYREAFGLECKAFLKARNEMGLTNIEVMIPVLRTVEEAKRVIETMAKYGLKRGENGLKVIGMCEVPSNVILAEDFLEILDGFSIGSNDLTQLTLGVDRDSELVSHVYDERNLAVKKLVQHVIGVCNKKGKYIGICGQAPSDYPEFAEFVVRAGIQTISLNPDTIVKTTLAIAELEKTLTPGAAPQFLWQEAPAPARRETAIPKKSPQRPSTAHKRKRG
ncbi:MAG: phosphoenolpyruvate synthase [Nanoarchaeota archaeon]|nr:phosphoenolpyruvate synthase [Nanoarchaeota archaeon]